MLTSTRWVQDRDAHQKPTSALCVHLRFGVLQDRTSCCRDRRRYFLRKIMHSSTVLWQSQRCAVRAPFSSQQRAGRRTSSHVAAASNGETRATTIHKIIESQGQLMVPGKTSFMSHHRSWSLLCRTQSAGCSETGCTVHVCMHP
jgi:hypothetical protein